MVMQRLSRSMSERVRARISPVPGAGVDREAEHDPYLPVMAMCISEQCLYFMLAQRAEFRLTGFVFARFVHESEMGEAVTT